MCFVWRFGRLSQPQNQRLWRMGSQPDRDRVGRRDRPCRLRCFERAWYERAREPTQTFEGLCPSVKKTPSGSRGIVCSLQAFPCAWEYFLRHLLRALTAWLSGLVDNLGTLPAVREPTNAIHSQLERSLARSKGAGPFLRTSSLGELREAL